MDSSEASCSATPSYGYIKTITLRNFMCHEELSLTLTDKLNFIVGRNGSGKSAILCGIILGLGGKALFADRSSSVIEYIRYGHKTADIEIALCNQGPCAYKPEQYGEQIIIHRRLHRTGASKYELKSADGHLVSRRAADLKAILTCFNIQVQNPACILTQDHSRNFLHALNARSLYQFYMESTQLAGIKQKLASCREKMVETRRTMEYKRKGMEISKGLISEMEEKLRRLEMKQQAEIMLEKVEKEFTWALVKQHEDEVERAKTAIVDKQQELRALEDNIRAEEASLTALDNELGRYRAEAAECEDAIRNYQLDKERCTMDAEAKQLKIAQEKAVLASLKAEVIRLSERLERYEEKMSDMQGKSRSATDSQSAAKQQREVEALQLDVKRSVQLIQVADGDCLRLTNSVSNLERNLQEKKSELDRMNEHRRTNTTKMTALRSSAGGRLARFGINERRLAVMVHGEQRELFSKEPRGPIGSLITVVDAQWTRAVECCLGPLLYGYVCDNFRDADRLRSVASKAGLAPENLLIIVTEFGNEQLYQLPRLLVECPYPTVLSVLQCDDAVVTNVLIDERSIEKTLLFKDESVMVRVMRTSRPGGFTLAFSAEGDQCITQPCFRKYKPPGRRTYVLTSSNEDVIEQLKEECKELAAKEGTVREEITTLKGHLVDQRTELSTRHGELKELKQAMTAKQARLNALRSAGAENSSFEKDFSLFERQVDELKKKLTSVKAQQSERETRLADSETEAKQLRSSLDRMERDRLDMVNKEKEIADKIRKGERERNATVEKKTAFARKHEEVKVDLVALQVERKACNARLKKAMNEAQQISPVRVNVERSIEDIKNHLEQLNLAIEYPIECEYTLEELTESLHSSKLKLSSITKEYNEACSTLEQLSRQVEKREKFFASMRRRVDTNVEDTFKSYISLRYSNSGLLIDHERESLEIYVKGNTEGMSGQRGKNMRNLSGGERSFSTVCLLLSLWEIVDVPFRCLDEFDVFMDMINRDVAIDALVEYAGEPKNLHRQFLFFSPLQISDAMRSESVNLIHMVSQGATEAEE